MPVSTTAPDRWIVLKFGGTSVSRRHRWDTIGRLAKRRAEEHSVEGQDARVLVVVSALSGVTNELTAVADGATDSAERIDKLEQRHREFVAELELDADQVLGERLSALRALATDSRAGERTLPWQAEVLGQGELLSSTLGAAYLRAARRRSRRGGLGDHEWRGCGHDGVEETLLRVGALCAEVAGQIDGGDCG